MHKSGFILITILLFFVLLVSLVAVYLFIATTEMRQAGNALDYAKALALAEAGINRGIREIRDDVLTTTQTGVADLRGFLTVVIQGEVIGPDNVRYFDEGEYADLEPNISGTPIGSSMTLSYFDRNYLGTRIERIQLGVRYKRGGSAGRNPRLEVLYTTNGTFPQVGNRSIRAVVNSDTYGTPRLRDITNDPNWNWAGGSEAVWQQINSSNFQIRARAYLNRDTDRRVHIDYLFLKVEYEIDSNSETWYQGFNNIALGDGEIESVSIIDESGKVNINYASRSNLTASNTNFLFWLFWYGLLYI